MQTRKYKVTDSPIALEKLLTGMTESHEPNLLSSPNAFDWEKRLALPGGSPNAFALSLNGANDFQGSSQLFDYPSLPQENPVIDSSAQELNNLIMMKGGSIDEATAFSFLTDHINESYSETSHSSMNGADAIQNPLPPKRIIHNRKDSHRESERRRRESFKNAMFHLENLVVLTLNRAGTCKILGKGPNRKLAHAEIYRMARDIIVTLKEEIGKVERMNSEISSKL